MKINDTKFMSRFMRGLLVACDLHNNDYSERNDKVLGLAHYQRLLGVPSVLEECWFSCSRLGTLKSTLIAMAKLASYHGFSIAGLIKSPYFTDWDDYANDVDCDLVAKAIDGISHYQHDDSILDVYIKISTIFGTPTVRGSNLSILFVEACEAVLQRNERSGLCH